MWITDEENRTCIQTVHSLLHFACQSLAAVRESYDPPPCNSLEFVNTAKAAKDSKIEPGGQWCKVANPAGLQIHYTSTGLQIHCTSTESGCTFFICEAWLVKSSPSLSSLLFLAIVFFLFFSNFQVHLQFFPSSSQACIPHRDFC